MEELYITLYGDGKEEILYRVESIFDIENTEQLYCSAVPADGGDVVFLRCYLSENDEDTEITIEAISNTAEYNRVATSYEKNVAQAAMEAAHEELSAQGDFITVTDSEGNKRNFIVHTIFEDEETHRSYIAVQEVDETGNIFEEISLYRFDEADDTATIDMIPSDMEYEKAKKIFTNLIEIS